MKLIMITLTGFPELSWKSGGSQTRLPLSPESKRKVGGDSQRSIIGDSLSVKTDDTKCN
jgi:hypothetical protein